MKMLNLNEPFKVCEIVIPTPYILNDNNQNHYKQNMGKMQWLERQMHMAIGSEEKKDNLICWVMGRDVADSLIKDKKSLGLVLTHYKALGTKFDLANYERCYKPLIDALTGAGYFEDDNYSIANPVIFLGGSDAEWKSDSKLGINALESSAYSKVKDYMFDTWPQVQERMSQPNTPYNKISNYDLFQIWLFNREE